MEGYKINRIEELSLVSDTKIYINRDELVNRINKCVKLTNPEEQEWVKDECIRQAHCVRHADVVEVVRCKDCAVPHNKWTGCPNLNGMIPPPDFYCAKGERRADNEKRKTD
jgi:hypothetical protein